MSAGRKYLVGASIELLYRKMKDPKSVVFKGGGSAVVSDRYTECVR